MSVKSKKSVVPMKSITPSKSVSSTKPVSGRRTYTSQFKREAVELVEREGVSVAEAARRLSDRFLLGSKQMPLSRGRRSLHCSGVSSRVGVACAVRHFLGDAHVERR